jgi:hypothetical protein
MTEFIGRLMEPEHCEAQRVSSEVCHAVVTLLKPGSL